MRNPAAILSAKAGIKGIANITTNLENDMWSITGIFLWCLSRIDLKPFRTIQKDMKHPIDVAIHDTKKPMYGPKTIILIVINTASGYIGIIDSNIINIVHTININTGSRLFI